MDCIASDSAIRVAVTLQAQAQHRHLKIIEQAIRHHGMSMVHDDPASNDHRRMHVGMAMVHEHEMNARVLQDLERNMQVCGKQNT